MPKSRRRHERRSEAQWTEILQRFASSGLGPREFCRREALSLSSLQRWRGRIERQPAGKFVELVPTTTSGSPAVNWALELSLPNGVCLRLRG